MTTRGKETQWRGYAPSLTGWTVTVDAGVHQIVADNGNWVCECMPQAAPLIAAAPDMLAALKHVEAIMSIVPPQTAKAEYLAALDHARSALAKAQATPDRTSEEG